MVREHANNEGKRLPCSTTPDNCMYAGNAGHIDENSTPEEVAEFNRIAEETAARYVLGNSTT